jgi:hypothetical protein
VGGALGKGLRNFKQGIKEAEGGEGEGEEEKKKLDTKPGE